MASASMSDRIAFKHLKEEFVSGLKGGSIQEINAVTLVALSSYAVWCALQTRFAFFARAPLRRAPMPRVVDFVLNWVGILLSTTVYASHPLALNLLIAVPALVIYMLPAVHDSSRYRLNRAILRRRDRKHRDWPDAALGAPAPGPAAATPDPRHMPARCAPCLEGNCD
ncbi:uncharacterized protein V1510DRAFT_305432, partial [Dipodascopsis tothii]|uniref:uncharacterized protein n=1 Tax=Dipodascopsis tothii TaxID=44089 RepID=UPI0034CFB171